MMKMFVEKVKKLAEDYKKSDLCLRCAEKKSAWNKKINSWGKELVKNNVNANMVSIFGFIVGMIAVNFLAMNLYFEALICILINRFCDVMDGAVARAEGVTKFGVFLDASLDFIFYAGVIFGFALANPDENALPASFLLFGFTASASAMLTYGIVAYADDKKAKDLSESPFYLGGIAQGFETIAAFILLCLMPFAFLPISIALGCWCIIKALIIISSAYYKLVIQQKNGK